MDHIKTEWVDHVGIIDDFFFISLIDNFIFINGLGGIDIFKTNILCRCDKLKVID